MPLKLADFNCIMVNWKEKHINLKKIAKEYNIGYSSFVFVDDQKFGDIAEYKMIYEEAISNKLDK